MHPFHCFFLYWLKFIQFLSLAFMHLCILNCWFNGIEEDIDDDAGVDAFKKIARHSTHAILAACQLEHQKPGTSSSSTLCSHRDDNEHSNKSTLMPNCCRQCFNMFVRNVVSSTMMEKVGGGASSSSWSGNMVVKLFCLPISRQHYEKFCSSQCIYVTIMIEYFVNYHVPHEKGLNLNCLQSTCPIQHL